MKNNYILHFYVVAYNILPSVWNINNNKKINGLKYKKNYV